MLPANTFVSQGVKDEATKLGVKLWVTYAFQNKETGTIVFSNPELLNTEILKKLGNLDRQIVKPDSNGKNSLDGVKIDYDKAKRGHADSNEMEERHNNESQ